MACQAKAGCRKRKAHVHCERCEKALEFWNGDGPWICLPCWFAVQQEEASKKVGGQAG